MREYPLGEFRRLLLVSGGKGELPGLAVPTGGVDLDRAAILAIPHGLAENVREDDRVVLEVPAAVHDQHDLPKARRAAGSLSPNVAREIVPQTGCLCVGEQEGGVAHRFLAGRRDAVAGQVQVEPAAARAGELE